jgi:hypothetical protein
MHVTQSKYVLVCAEVHSASLESFGVNIVVDDGGLQIQQNEVFLDSSASSPQTSGEFR